MLWTRRRSVNILRFYVFLGLGAVKPSFTSQTGSVPIALSKARHPILSNASFTEKDFVAFDYFLTDEQTMQIVTGANGCGENLIFSKPYFF